VNESLQVHGTIYSIAVRNKGVHFVRYMKDSAASCGTGRAVYREHSTNIRNKRRKTLGTGNTAHYVYLRRDTVLQVTDGSHTIRKFRKESR
jgi:hypothetical protein